MAKLYPIIYFNGAFVSSDDTSVSVASSAVLYGLSVYTVFHAACVDDS